MDFSNFSWFIIGGPLWITGFRGDMNYLTLPWISHGAKHRTCRLLLEGALQDCPLTTSNKHWLSTIFMLGPHQCMIDPSGIVYLCCLFLRSFQPNWGEDQRGGAISQSVKCGVRRLVYFETIEVIQYGKKSIRWIVGSWSKSWEKDSELHWEGGPAQSLA